jgi:hypothetical protein
MAQDMAQDMVPGLFRSADELTHRSCTGKSDLSDLREANLIFEAPIQHAE